MKVAVDSNVFYKHYQSEYDASCPVCKQTAKVKDGRFVDHIHNGKKCFGSGQHHVQLH